MPGKLGVACDLQSYQSTLYYNIRGCIRNVLQEEQLKRIPTMIKILGLDYFVGLGLLNSIAINTEAQPKTMIYTEEIFLFNDKLSKIREELAVQFFTLSLEVSASCEYNKNIVAVLQFLALCNSKEREFKNQFIEILAKTRHEIKYHNKNSNSIVLHALEASFSKQPFIHFLSKNCQTIFLQGSYRGFRCNPSIIYRAIIAVKSLYTTGSERSADKLLQIIIESYQKRDLKLSDKEASELYKIGGQISIALNDHRSAHMRLMSSFANNKNNFTAITLLLTINLRNFRFDLCYSLLYQMTQLSRDQTFKAISLFTAGCVDYTRIERDEFILTMREDQFIVEDDQKGQKAYFVKYFRFGHCCAFFMYVVFDHQGAYSQFKKWFYLLRDLVSIEGMCLSSYRIKDYTRALSQFYQMRRIMPYERGWWLVIAAVCYFKLRDQKKALTMLAKVDENSLTFEEDVFYSGVLCLVGQQSKAINRLRVLQQHVNSIMNTQRAIVMLLCEQKLGNTAQVSHILKSLPYLEPKEKSIDHRYMQFQQFWFLTNFHFQRNRLAEGRHYVKKVKRMGESLKKIDAKKAVQRLMEEFNEHKKIEIELIFR